MAETQHFTFYGYPVEVKQSEEGWYVQVRNRDGDLVLDTHVSEKPVRQQLEDFVGRMFPQALPVSREAVESVARFAKEHPETAAKIRTAITKRRVKKPIETGFATRTDRGDFHPAPAEVRSLTPAEAAEWERERLNNPAPASVADLARQLKF